MFKKYRKKPITIEAFHYTKENIGGLMDWIEQYHTHNSEILEYNREKNEYEIITLEGNHLVLKGDYVIRGVQGEFYPCKSDIFKETYDELD